MQYSTRNITEHDKSWLDKLRRDVYRDLFFATWGGWDEERHNRHFASCWNAGNIKIIELDTESIGMVQIFHQNDQIEIAEIQIAPPFQGKGLAKTIIQDILATAQKQGKKVTLSAGLQNQGALKLYQKLGFSEIKRTDSKVYLEI